MTAWKIILKYMSLLALFCGAAGLLLPAVYELTAPRKAAYQQQLETDSLRLVFPDAENYLAKDGYYEALDSDGNLAGYILKVTSAGYGSDIEMLAGLRQDDWQITSVKILSQAETPGLGSKVEDGIFLTQLFGRTAGALRLKKDGGDIDAITGATITSRAVVDGLRKNIETFSQKIRAEE